MVLKLQLTSENFQGQNKTKQKQNKKQNINGSQLWNEKFECPWYNIYRAEAAGLSLSNYIFKTTKFVSVWNVGQIKQNWKQNGILSITA